MKGFVDAATGFAAGAQGAGAAYVRLMPGGVPRVLRVPFSVDRFPALSDREIGYAALTAVAAELCRRGIERVRFTIDDERLAADLIERRELPAALILAYVRLRCALNRFKDYEIAASAGESDLTARARSETAIHAAA